MSRYFTKTLASLEPYTPGEQLRIADIVKLNAEIEEIVKRENVLREEIRKIIEEIEG